MKIAGSAGYGFTVACMLTSLPVDGYHKPGSAGKRNEWFDVRLFDDEGREVPVGEPGEIVAPPLQPNVMFEGYSKRPADTLKVTAVLRAGSRLSEKELCLWMIERVPYFAVPRYIEFRKALPKNPVGRILKYELRDEGCTPATWDRNASDIKLTKR